MKSPAPSRQHTGSLERGTCEPIRITHFQSKDRANQGIVTARNLVR